MTATFSSLRRWAARIVAPAKINLGLHVAGQRADGYHLLSSLVTFVSLWDRLSVLITPGSGKIAVSSSTEAAPSGPGNLAARAADSFLGYVGGRETDPRQGCDVEIRIDKAIPVGAGLGGGSSDAAATLLALNRAWGSPLSQNELLTLALPLGADVPLFVRGQSGLIGGIGETFAAHSVQEHQPLVLAFGEGGLLTKAVFSEYDRQPIAESPDPARRNDLQGAAIRLAPGIECLLRLLESLGGQGARMTGSGAAVFAAFPSFRAARRAAKSARQAGIWARAVYTLENSVVTL